MSLTNSEHEELIELYDKQLYELNEKHLLSFIRQAWDILEPGTKFINNWHIEYTCEHLEAVYSGEIKRLLINIPPGHMKSIMVTVCFPAWVWIQNPYKRFISACYSQEISTDLSVKRRDLIFIRLFEILFTEPYKHNNITLHGPLELLTP